MRLAIYRLFSPLPKEGSQNTVQSKTEQGFRNLTYAATYTVTSERHLKKVPLCGSGLRAYIGLLIEKAIIKRLDEGASKGKEAEYLESIEDYVFDFVVPGFAIVGLRLDTLTIN